MGSILQQLQQQLFQWVMDLAQGRLNKLQAEIQPYLRLPKSSIDNLQQAYERLEDMKVDVVREVELLDLRGLICSKEVHSWIVNVEEIQNRRTQVINYYDELKAYSPYRLLSGIQSTRLLQEVIRLGVEGRKLEVKGMKPPVDPVQEKSINSKLFGLNSYIEQISEFLADDQEHIIGIVGKQGVGKTALLKLTNNNLQPNGLFGEISGFDRVIYLDASKDCDLEKFLKKIQTELGILWTRDDDTEDLAMAIYRFLKKKHFIVLVDDLREPQDLEKSGIPFKRLDKQLKGKMIITTRWDKVCGKMGIKKMIKMGPLNEDDAWLVFKENFAGDLILDPRFERFGKAIAKECNGLPLRLIDAARDVSSKNTVQEWQWTLNMMKETNAHSTIPNDESKGKSR